MISSLLLNARESYHFTWISQSPNKWINEQKNLFKIEIVWSQTNLHHNNRARIVSHCFTECCLLSWTYLWWVWRVVNNFNITNDTRARFPSSNIQHSTRCTISGDFHTIPNRTRANWNNYYSMVYGSIKCLNQLINVDCSLEV